MFLNKHEGIKVNRTQEMQQSVLTFHKSRELKKKKVYLRIPILTLMFSLTQCSIVNPLL